MAHDAPQHQPKSRISRLWTTILLFGCLIVGSLAGCGKAGVKTPTAPVAEAAPTDPMELERNEVREGATQLTEAISSLHDGVDSVVALRKSSKDEDLRKALLAISDSLDDAGASVSDYSSDPPDLEAFKADFANQDDRRLKAIEGANDALHDLDDATDALDPFLEHAAPEDKEAVQDLEDSMEDAQDSLIDAVKALGGKVEDDATTDLTDSSAPTAGGPSASTTGQN